MATNPIAKQMVVFQKQMVDFQKAAFESSFNALVSLQDRQEEMFTRMVEQIPSVPPEARAALEAWSDTFKQAREQFKSSADRSFELLDEFFERIQEGNEG